ncbi:glycosyltransferase family 4 protein [Luteococcus sp.]|uniref:glycosyltransferase family 4 protein n=1 Tax=Luteococcus sp. TaxID=1969402 RepID=UPI00373668C9
MSGPVAGRVVHLSTVHHSWDNRILNKECRALAEAGIDTHLVISADEDRTGHGLSVHAIRRRGRLARLVVSQWEALQWLRRLRPAVLHVHDPELIPLMVLWGRLGRCRIIYDAHEDLVKQIETKPYLRGRQRVLARGAARALVGLADRRCDAVVTVIDEIAQHFSTTRRGRPRPVVVVRNLPWVADFPPVSVRCNDPVAVYTGDISEERGFSRMVKAVEQVPGARLVLAGRSLVPTSRTGSHPEVEMLGLVPPGELPGILARARLGLVLLDRLPNYAHSLPTKLVEYMASGIPFLATDFPYWRQLFEDVDAGVFVDVDDPAAVREALERLLTDPEECSRLGANGRRAVEEHFGFDLDAARLVRLTRQLLG